MAAKKKTTKKKTAKTKAAPRVVVPKHPLMLNDQAWNRELVMNHICDNLAVSSKGIGTVLTAGYEGHDMPSYSTIMKWLDEDESLSEKYAHAKEAQADFMADELLHIADNEADDQLMVDGVPLMIDGKAVRTKTAQSVQHARLRVDTRKWLASKLKPKRYGDKVQVGGADDLPPVEVSVTRIELVAMRENGKD